MIKSRIKFMLVVSGSFVMMFLLSHCLPKTPNLPDVNVDALGIDRDSSYWNYDGGQKKEPKKTDDGDDRFEEDDSVGDYEDDDPRQDRYESDSRSGDRTGKSDGRYRIVTNADWNEITARNIEYADKGYRIVDVEIYHDNDYDKYYAGVWHYQKGSHRFLKLSSWEVFKSKLDEYKEAGFVPIDIELGDDEWDEVEILAIWKPGRQRYTVREKMDWKTFLSVYEDLAGRGYRLIDLEANSDEWEASVQYSGIWHQVKLRQKLFKASSLSELLQKRKQYGAEDLRIADLEIVVEDGRKKYLAVWHPGNDKQSIWLEAELSTFTAKKKEFDAMKQYLVDLEVSDDDFTTRFTGVWRGGKAEKLPIDMAPDTRGDTRGDTDKKKNNPGGLRILE